MKELRMKQLCVAGLIILAVIAQAIVGGDLGRTIGAGMATVSGLLMLHLFFSTKRQKREGLATVGDVNSNWYVAAFYCAMFAARHIAL